MAVRPERKDWILERPGGENLQGWWQIGLGIGLEMLWCSGLRGGGRRGLRESCVMGPLSWIKAGPAETI